MHAVRDWARVTRCVPAWSVGVVTAMSLTAAPGIVSDARAQNPGAVVEDRIPDGEQRGLPELEAIESLIHVASLESRTVLAQNAARLTERWSEVAARVPTGADSSLIIRVWTEETKRSVDCFNGALERASLTPETRGEEVRRCLEPARNAEALLPAVRAVARGERSAVLVITSVGCECVMNACRRMNGLWDGVAVAEPAIALSRIDEMLVPRLAEGWDLYQIPTWVFLETTGEVGFMLEGTETDDSTVLSEVRTWLGEERHSLQE